MLPQRRPTLSYQLLRTQMPLSDAELYDKIRRTVTNKHELQVLESFLIFNKCVPSSLRFPLLSYSLWSLTCRLPLIGAS